MTTDCDDDSVDRRLPDLGSGASGVIYDEDTAILVEDPSAKYGLTARADYDVHTALIRGLASYVAGLRHAIAGREIGISRVVTNYAEHDDGAVRSPSASVSSAEVGQYAVNSGMAPSRPIVIENVAHRANLVTTLTCSGLYEVTQIDVMVMCEDDVQRAGVRRMLEDAFWPVEWMSGFRLVLPPYHNVVSEFLCTSGQQADAADQAAAGIRPLTMRLAARCPVYRLHEMPLARPSVTGTIVNGKRRI